MKNIGKVAGARNFYEIEGALELGGIEEYFGRLENDFGPVRDKILAVKDVTGLTEDERRVVSYFVATQFVSTQEFRTAVREMIVSIKNSLVGERVSVDYLKQIQEAMTESSIRNIHLSQLDGIPWIAGTLMEKKWIVFIDDTLAYAQYQRQTKRTIPVMALTPKSKGK